MEYVTDRMLAGKLSYPTLRKWLEGLVFETLSYEDSREKLWNIPGIFITLGLESLLKGQMSREFVFKRIM